MSFDIPNLHIPDNSAASRVIEAIMSTEHVSSAEAVRRALQRLEPPQQTVIARERRGPRAPIVTDDPEGFIGMFNDKPGFHEAIEAVIASRSDRYMNSR